VNLNVIRAFLTAVGLLAAGAPPASAEVCKFNMSGYRFLTVETEGAMREYQLRSRDPRFPLQPLGYHATAIIECKDCLEGKPVSALIWLALNSLTAESVEQVRRSLESGISWMHRPATSLEKVDDRVTLQIGSLIGWVHRFAAAFHGQPSHDVIIVLIQDSCIGLLAIIETSSQHRGQPTMGEVQPLLDALDVVEVEPGTTLAAHRSAAPATVPRRAEAAPPAPRTMDFDEFRRTLEEMRH